MYLLPVGGPDCYLPPFMADAFFSFTNGIDLPAPNEELSLADIKAKALQCSVQIFKNWTQLNTVIKRFDAVIQKRWIKKTQKQREAVIHRAHPTIPRQHRPDFVGCRFAGHHVSWYGSITDHRHRKRKKRARADPINTRQTTAFLWPYINLEDLQQGHLLPLYLHSRGRDLPEQFVASDLQGAHKGHGWAETVEDGNRCMAFADGKTPKKYGRVFLQQGTVKQRVLRPTYSPIVGLFILEIQDGIYKFLADCAIHIMHDTDLPAILLSPSVPAPNPPSPDDKQQRWRSLPALALEMPYRAPGELDIDSVQMLVSAKRSAAEDHIWLLREDPGYFVDNLKDCMEHSLDWFARPKDVEHMYKHVAGKVIADAFCMYYLWEELDQHLLQLPSVEIQLADANTKTGRLHAYDEAAWAILDTIIEKLFDIQLEALRVGVPTSPRIRIISDIDQMAGGKQEWDLKDGSTEVEHRVYVLFWSLFDASQRDLHGINALISEIQHTIDHDPEAAALMDDWVIESFSNVALLAEFRRLIATFLPWSRGWQLNNVAEHTVVAIAIENAVVRDDCHAKTLTNAPCHCSTTLGNPLDGRFHFPVDRKRTKETANQMRSAEAELASFWSEIARYFRKFQDRGLYDEFLRKSCRKEGVRKTKKWVEPAKERIVVPIPASPASPLRQLDVNAWCIESGKGSRKRDLLESAIKPVTKIKTRGEPKQTETPPTTPGRANNNNNDDEEDAAAVDHLPIIKLPKRAYKVFAALFPTSTTAAKELSWDEFCCAMNAVGLQPEKLYGSVWIFRPSQVGGFKGRRGKALSGLAGPAPVVVEERPSASDDSIQAGSGGLQLKRSIQFHEPKVCTLLPSLSLDRIYQVRLN